MLDINYIKENREKVEKIVKQKGIDVNLDLLFELDENRRDLIQKVDDLRHQRNEAAREKNIEKGKEIKQRLDLLESELKTIEDRFNHLMLYIPNIPVEGVPEGDESANEVLRKDGNLAKLDFDVKDHVELGESLDIIDITRATKVSGARFAYLKNEGALLELALVQYAMDRLVKESFSPVIPPVLIKQSTTEGLGYWAGGNHNNYYLVHDLEESEAGVESPNPLYLVGTAEHALVPMFQNEVLSEDELPKRFAGFSSCFRREAGTYGKDTRGILRVHQFDKVEMVSFVKEENDELERRNMLALAEGFLKDLGLPYQVVKLASGDLSFPAAETIDIETWIPSQGKYRETHSISTTTTFQSRRFNLKYKKKDGSTGYVHVLNGTAFAIGRMIIAILENYQQKDGSVKIPEVLQKYTNFSEIRPK